VKYLLTLVTLDFHISHTGNKIYIRSGMTSSLTCSVIDKMEYRCVVLYTTSMENCSGFCNTSGEIIFLSTSEADGGNAKI